jgi:hypothetical protein
VPVLRCTVTVAGGARLSATAVRRGRRIARATGNGSLRIVVPGTAAARLTVTVTPRAGAGAGKKSTVQKTVRAKKAHR